MILHTTTQQSVLWLNSNWNSYFVLVVVGVLAVAAAVISDSFTLLTIGFFFTSLALSSLTTSTRIWLNTNCNLCFVVVVLIAAAAVAVVVVVVVVVVVAAAAAVVVVVVVVVIAAAAAAVVVDIVVVAAATAAVPATAVFGNCRSHSYPLASHGTSHALSSFATT